VSAPRWIITAGPTYEDLDPVRFLGNRSSGKMGFAVAEAARDAGFEVVLIAGPVHLDTPDDVSRVDVRSAADMHAAVMASLPADVYIGAAAVADFTPAHVANDKIKKQSDQGGLTLELVRTRDILADVARDAQRPRVVVGFAAETRNVIAYARGKLERKGLDLICANQVGVEGGGFESDRNTLQLVWADGETTLGPNSKHAIAWRLVQHIQDAFPA
jgi:phosphopantothenoylcysteine decarboxylase/phosphopantothenate--cysteine ligase